MPYAAVGEIVLKLAGPRPETGEARPGGRLAGRPQQACLAEPSRSLDEDDPATALPGLAQRPAELRKLTLALKKRRLDLDCNSTSCQRAVCHQSSGACDQPHGHRGRDQRGAAKQFHVTGAHRMRGRTGTLLAVRACDHLLATVSRRPRRGAPRSSSPNPWPVGCRARVRICRPGTHNGRRRAPSSRLRPFRLGCCLRLGSQPCSCCMGWHRLQ